MKNKLYIALFLLLTAVAGLTAIGCVKQTPVPQYSDDVTFSVVYTHDDMTNLTSSAVKNDVISSLNTVITDRNLKLASIDFNAVASEMTTIRDTERRIQLLRQYARGSQIILLTEVSTEFYSALSGRYRWDVNVHLSLYDMITRNTLEERFTVPAVLMYSHEDGDDAITSVEPEIQRRMGSLIDTFMKGRTVRDSAPEAAASVPAPAPAPRTAQPRYVEPIPIVEPTPVVEPTPQSTPASEAEQPSADENESSTLN